MSLEKFLIDEDIDSYEPLIHPNFATWIDGQALPNEYANVLLA